MIKKCQPFIFIITVFLLTLILFQSSVNLQARQENIATKYPGIPGIYEMDIQGKTVTLQIYFKEDKLRTIEEGDRLGYYERHYQKSEHQIPMRDGARLFTQVYSPLDSSEPHPIILFRSPYGIEPYGERYIHYIVPSLFFSRENYILVYQDIRGRSMSEGEFKFLAPFVKNKKSSSDVDESSDADWVVKVIDVFPGNAPDPNNNPGNVRMGGTRDWSAGISSGANSETVLKSPSLLCPER